MRQVIIRKSAPLLLPLLGLFAGCAPDDFANNNSNDPLYGAPPPPRPPALPYQPPAAATVPPLPAPDPSHTLTGLTTAPTPRIPTDAGAAGWQAPVTTPPVVLQPLQPLPTPAAPTAPVPPKAPDVQLAGSVTAAPDVLALWAQLQAKGARGCGLSKTDRGIVLGCVAPNPAQPNSNLHYEVPIQGGNLASAMQALLDKIPANKN